MEREQPYLSARGGNLRCRAHGSALHRSDLRAQSPRALGREFREHQTATVALIPPLARLARRNKGRNRWQRRLGRGGEESWLGNIVLVTKGAVFAPAGLGISIHQHEILGCHRRAGERGPTRGRSGLYRGHEPPRSPGPNLGAETDHLSPRAGPPSQVTAAPLPPPEKKHKSMPHAQPRHDLFMVAKRNLTPALGAVRKAGTRYRPSENGGMNPVKRFLLHTCSLCAHSSIYFTDGVTY